MQKQNKIDSKEISLEIVSIIGKHIFNTDHLHYGYWTNNLDINLRNFPQAQQNYCNFMISQIPDEVKTILDVGCGAGGLALDLINNGYCVDCVSPSQVLTKHTRNLLGEKSHIFECSFEQIQTENLYDMVLFGESFQYVNLEKALQNSIKLLNEGGYLLICDFFRTKAKGENMHGGGHELVRFYDLISQSQLELIKDIDITKETAPNLDIVNELLTNVGHPIWNLVSNLLYTKYHFISKLLHWKYRKRIAKIHRKYFRGERNARNFAIYKSYRFLLYKKI